MSTTWTGTAADGLWGDTPGAANLNWSGGLTPDTTDDVIIGGSDNITISSSGLGAVGHNITFSGYTGQLTASSGTAIILSPYGSLTLSAGMTVNSGYSTSVTFQGSGTFTPNGNNLGGGLEINSAPSSTLTLAGSFTGNILRRASGATIAFGASVITLAGAAFPILNNQPTGLTTWSTGHIILNTGTADTVTVGADANTDSDNPWPPVSVIGSGTLSLTGRNKFQSFDMSAFTGTFTVFDNS